MEHASSPSVDKLTQAARDALDVRRVFGEAYTSGETTVIPVAKVLGGSGMGFGGGGMPGAHRAHAPGADGDDGGLGEGAGGGFGARTKPVGAYVVRGDTVRWHPAIDLTRLATGGQLVMAIAILAWACSRRRR